MCPQRVKERMGRPLSLSSPYGRLDVRWAREDVGVAARENNCRGKAIGGLVVVIWACRNWPSSADGLTFPLRRCSECTRKR